MDWKWVLGAGVLCAAAAVLYRVIRAVSAWANVARTFKRELELQQEQLARTPKSVSGMTQIYLPQIARDFPQFHWPEFRQRAENLLRSALAALDALDLGRLEGASHDLHEQVRLTVESGREGGRHIHYEQVRVHRTEITRYERRAGDCTVTLQSAVEYVSYTTEGTAVTAGTRDRPVQTKYNLELVYIQDPEKAAEKSGDRAVGLTCPNCGAAVTDLGRKRCAYCGGEVVELNLYAWSFNRFYEVTG